MAMDIEFDPEKDRANHAKHGVSLALAKKFEWDDAVIWQDVRKNYGEMRFNAYGYVGLRLYALTFVKRGVRTRIISMRKANTREVAAYAQT